MITIGINYIGGLGHDSSAALAINGKIEYAIAEERLSRNKQDGNFPIQALQACLNYKGLSLNAIDAVVFGWPKLREYFSANLKLNLSGSLNESIPGNLLNLLNYYRSRTTRDETVALKAYDLHPKKVIHINHHLAHALSVLPYLKNEEALIFVVDGRGISESTSVYLKNGFQLELVKQINFPNSLGLYYAEMTSMCGFRKYSDEWKVMGLAPFGKNSFDLSHLINAKDGSHFVDHSQLLNADKLTLNGKQIVRPNSDQVAINDEDLKNLAHSAQYSYERTILKFMKYYTEKYQIKSIGMGGGVGLNCKANGYVMRELDLDEFFIQPAATDDGTALGAALYPFYQSKTLQKETFNPYSRPPRAGGATRGGAPGGWPQS